MSKNITPCVVAVAESPTLENETNAIPANPITTANIRLAVGIDRTKIAVTNTVITGMFGTGIGYALYGVLVARAGPIRGAIGLFLTPIVATFNGIIFRNDSVRLFAFVGMAIVVVGAVLTSQPESTTTE